MQNQPNNKNAPETRRKTEDARRPMRAPNFGANYGPSASYTPATDNPACEQPTSADTGGDCGGGE